MPQFEKVEVPTGAFISWGKQGQSVTVKTVAFDATGGRDFQGNVCPQLIGTVTEDADNYRDKGATHERVKAGEMVTVNGGIANLKKGLLQADPTPGDLVRMTFVDTYKTKEGEGKVIQVEIARAEPDAVGEDDI